MTRVHKSFYYLKPVAHLGEILHFVYRQTRWTASFSPCSVYHTPFHIYTPVPLVHLVGCICRCSSRRVPSVAKLGTRYRDIVLQRSTSTCKTEMKTHVCRDPSIFRATLASFERCIVRFLKSSHAQSLRVEIVFLIASAVYKINWRQLIQWNEWNLILLVECRREDFSYHEHEICHEHFRELRENPSWRYTFNILTTPILSQQYGKI